MPRGAVANQPPALERQHPCRSFSPPKIEFVLLGGESLSIKQLRNETDTQGGHLAARQRFIAKIFYITKRQFALFWRLQKALRSQVRPSRNPFEPLAPVIELDDPLQAVADMMQRMRLDRPIGNPLDEAIWARDILLIKLLTTNALRIRNVATLCYSPQFVDGRKPDNRPALYKRTDGSWGIFVPKHMLKNRRGPAVRHYDAPVHTSATRDLEHHRQSRPVPARYSPAQSVQVA
ncbi:MAG: hypothetical protein I4O36_05840 [Ralstonia pickettii]|uniref:hypothetical protein n=1 Tax=Ralstonia TaxID=48736 RepID=UPI00147B73F3|nr:MULTISPECIES: hypothetical protein [Ralstonia]MCL6456303.1 hypothetical protein [Ralstonia pickettii]